MICEQCIYHSASCTCTTVLETFPVICDHRTNNYCKTQTSFPTSQIGWNISVEFSPEFVKANPQASPCTPKRQHRKSAVLRILLLKRPCDKKESASIPETSGLLDLLVDQLLIGSCRKRRNAKQSRSNRKSHQQKTVIAYFVVNCTQTIQPGRHGCNALGALTGHMSNALV